MTQTCFVCAGVLKFLGPRGEYRYFVCRQCGTIQLNPMPTPRQLEEKYAHDYLVQNLVEHSMTPETWKKVSRPYLDAILKVVQRKKIRGPILDFGAGYGFLCELLIRAGFDCKGVELSEQKIAYCVEKDLPVRKGGFEVFEEKEIFSAVLMCAVFEHLSDHVECLKRIHFGLKPNGVVITLHPTARLFRLLAFIFRLGIPHRELPHLFGAFAPPWHAAFVSIRAMGLIAEQAGFEVSEIIPAPQGRFGGFPGLVQRCLGIFNKLGWALFRTHWPLLTSHVFVLRKKEFSSRPTSVGILTKK